MRILFADDHDLLKDALKAYLEAEGQFVVTLAATIDEALERMIDEGPFDLVLLDYQIPGMDGLLGLRRVIAAQDGRPVVLLTGVATAGTVTAALRFGATAVLGKTLPVDKVKNAIEKIISGDFLSESVQDPKPDGSPLTPVLTPRQEQVLRCIRNGLSNKQIARQLALHETTVKMHIKMLYAKLGVNSRTQAIVSSDNFNLI